MKTLSEHKLSIIMPCYNETETIEKILERINRVQLPIAKEIIIIDDYSTDGTRELLKKLEVERSSQIKVIYHEHNRGKGAALRTGFQAATGSWILIQDADLEYDPEDYHKLLKPALDGQADVVYGSRFVGGEIHRVLYFWHSVGNRFLTLLSNMVTNLNLTDMEVCYKLFKREIMEKIHLKEDRFGFEPEFTIKMSRLNLKIYEVGISYSGRTYKEGKKINYKDGFRAVYVIAKYGLLGR